MFDLFGFNPKTFTDDELLERVTELGKRIVWATRMGQFDMAHQFRNQKIMCENEQRERMLGSRFQMMKQSPSVVVESDPDLAREARKALEAQAEREAPKKGPRVKPFAITKERVRPTSTPTSDD